SGLPLHQPPARDHHHADRRRPCGHPLRVRQDLERPVTAAREDALLDQIQCAVTSFGYRHGPAPEATIVVDVRDLLRDPNVAPAVRELDGFDARVRQRVLATPGALALIDHTVLLVQGVLTEAPGAVVDVAVGCAG